MTTNTAAQPFGAGWEVVPAPKSAFGAEHACHFCQYGGLRRPVWIAQGTGGPVPAGADCAAVALYGKRAKGSAAAQRRARSAAADAEHKAREVARVREHRARVAAIALEAFRVGDENAVVETGVRGTFAAAGGAAVLGSFPEWLERLATDGDIGDGREY